MSDYVRIKCVRVLIGSDARLVEDWLDNHPEHNFYCAKNQVGFTITDRNYLDYIFDYEYGAECGEFGRTRYLTRDELSASFDKFEILRELLGYNPVLAECQSRLVDYCYYNGCDAPIYFDIVEECHGDMIRGEK